MNFRLKRLLKRFIPQPVLIATRPVRMFFHAQRRFDRRFNVDTSGIIELKYLDIENSNWQEGGEYDATPPRMFAVILKSIPLKYEDFTFVDMGSGKGAVLLYASEFPFKKVIGVEFSALLHQIAERNIMIYRNKTVKCRDVKSLCMDATVYPIPPEPTVFFFANPFKGKVLETVLANIEQSLADHPREIFVIYYHPLSRHAVWDQTGFLQQIRASPKYSIYTSSIRD